MSLLLDIYVFLDPHFKHRFSVEDEPVVKLMDEVKAYGDQNEVLQAGKRLSQGSLQVPTKKKGKLVQYLALDQSHLLHQGTMQELQVCLIEMYSQYPGLDIDESPF